MRGTGIKPIYLAFCYAGLVLVTLAPLVAQVTFNYSMYVTVTRWCIPSGIVYLVIGSFLWWINDRALKPFTYLRPSGILQPPR
jgi:hypothetical protein